tara:strand:+ start:472 stop:1155 length:684 start_codon:yes stop_codon:yes gene_type:complete
MITNTVYSHSAYFDVLEVFLEQWNLFYGEEIIVFSDKEYKGYKTVIYDEELSYTNRLIQCFENTEGEVFLYQHEDMFLYDYPDSKKLNDYGETLTKSNDSFIRLTKAGSCKFSQSDLNETLLNISEDSENFFAVQSTLWKKDDLIKFLKEAGSLNIWDLEATSHVINSRARLSGLCHFDNEVQRGGHHDSNMWPYVATAINKGQWNFEEYEKELSKIDKVLTNKRPR